VSFLYMFDIATVSNVHNNNAADPERKRVFFTDTSVHGH
jgi:hypothetical protein